MPEDDADMIKLVPVVCPNCSNRIYSGGEDGLFLCPNCNKLHSRKGKVTVIDFEVGSALRHAEGEKLYRPFWKLGVDFQISSMGSDGNLLLKMKNVLRSNANLGHIDMILPAYEVDAKNFRDLAERLTLQPVLYTPGHLEPGINRESCTVSIGMTDALANFAFLAIQTLKPGAIVWMDYGLRVTSRKLLYLPYYKKYDQYTQELTYTPGY